MCRYVCILVLVQGRNILCNVIVLYYGTQKHSGCGLDCPHCCHGTLIILSRQGTRPEHVFPFMFANQNAKSPREMEAHALGYVGTNSVPGYRKDSKR